MSSISMQMKEELCVAVTGECCGAAFLSALVHTAGTISFSAEGMSVFVESDLPALFPLVDELLGRFFGAEAAKEGSKIVVRGEYVTDLLLQLKILRLRDGLKVEEGINPSLIKEECCKKAYLRGAFLGGGCLTTRRGYHLEFACASKKLRDGLVGILGDFEIRAGGTARGESFVCYIKDSEMICDALVLMGAAKTCLHLNSLLAERSMKQTVARAANCDMANLGRLVSTSVAQCDAISRLGFIKNEKLRTTAEARLKHPDLSYEELGEILGVSKGSVKYRLNKLLELAESRRI